MTSSWERFKKMLASLDDEFHQEVDANVKARIESGEKSEVEWLDDPDPFGDNWRWLLEPAESS